jgi:hypothetical protein
LNRTLSISIFKGYLYISYSINGVTSGSDTYKLAEIYQIKEYLKKFIEKFSVKKEKLDIIISIDFIELSRYYKNTLKSVAYLQISPFYKNDKKKQKIKEIFGLDVHFLNVGLPKDKEFSSKLKQAAKEAKKLKLDTVIVNSIFSGVYKNREKDLIKEIKRYFKNFNLTSSEGYNTNNFILRENVLLLNYYYRGYSDKFSKYLRKTLESLGIESKIYGLRSNGYLMDFDELSKVPLKTKDSYYTNKLISYSNYIEKNNLLIIEKNDEGFICYKIKNKVVEKNEEYSTFDEIKLPPQTIKIQRYKDELELLSKLDYSEEENIFCINTDIIKNKIDIIKFKNNRKILNKGLQKAEYVYEIESTIFNADEEKIKNEILEMKSKAEKYLKEKSMTLKNKVIKLEKIDLKYVLHDSYFVKLKIEGYI